MCRPMIRRVLNFGACACEKLFHRRALREIFCRCGQVGRPITLILRLSAPDKVLVLDTRGGPLIARQIPCIQRSGSALPDPSPGEVLAMDVRREG
jgi:hypothetical protein